MASSEYGQAAVRELCDTLEGTFSTLTQMMGRTGSDDLRLAPLPSNKKSLEFTRAVLKHSFTPSKITDLVQSLRDMRSDVMRCITRLETTFQHVHTLYDIMNNGLARVASRASSFSTSTNLTVRVQLADWLKGWEGTWGLSTQDRSTSVSHPDLLSNTISFYFWLQLRDFLQSKMVDVGDFPSSLSSIVTAMGKSRPKLTPEELEDLQGVTKCEPHPDLSSRPPAPLKRC